MIASRYNNPKCDRMEALKAYLIYRKYDDLISELYDRKGELEVSWEIIPTEAQMEDVSNIWFDIFGEPYSLHLISNETELKRIVK